MRAEADPERGTPAARARMALLSLRGEAAERDANPGIIGDRVDSLASAIWDRDCARGVDWVAAYNVWLLLWERYRLKDLWHKLPGYYGGRTGNLPLVLELLMYGFWCRA